MVSFENFVKSMPPSLSKLKVIPSCCLTFKIPDDVTATITYLSFTELALYVLSFLHPRDLLRAAQTCRYWRILAEDNLLWREKCREVRKNVPISISLIVPEIA